MPARPLLIHFFASSTLALPEEPVPLTGIFDSGSWAVIDLALAGTAFLGFLALATVFLYRYFNGFSADEASADGSSPDSQVTSRPSDAQLLMLSRALPWLAIAALSAMCTVFLFAFSQDFSGRMLSLDRWSLSMIILFALQAASSLTALRRSAIAHSRKVDSDPDLDDVVSQVDQAAARRRLKLHGSKDGHFEDDGDSDRR